MSTQPGGNARTDPSNNGPGRGGGGGRNRKPREGGGGPRGRGSQVSSGSTQNNDERNNDADKRRQQQQHLGSKVDVDKKEQSGADTTMKQGQQSANKSNRSRNQRNNQQRSRKSSKADPQTSTESSNEDKLKLEQEKRDQEAAEVARKIEEEKRKLIEQRTKEKSDREAKLKEACDVLRVTLDTAILHSTNRQALSSENLELSRKDFESSKKKLKTDLKKCTTFVKKIKSGSAWSMKVSEIQQDISTLNLSRYVEEVVQAVIESNIKITDLSIVTSLCIAMHQRYPEFLTNLLPTVWGVVTSSSIDTLKLRRIYVRLVTEFLLNGLIPSKEIKTFIKCISEWTGSTSGYAVQDANLIVAFGRSAGFEIFGITPTSVTTALNHVELERKANATTPPIQQEVSTETKGLEGLEDLSGPVMLSEPLVTEASALGDQIKVVLKEQRAVSNDATELISKHFVGAYGTLTSSLLLTHRKLQKLEKRCEQDRLLAGSISETREKGLNDARKLLDSLLKSVEALADLLDQPLPALEEAGDEDNSQSGGGVEVWTKGQDGESSGEYFGPFDDEDTRAFYCDIPDLLTTYPPALLGLQPEEIEKKKVENARKYGNESLQDSVEEEIVEEVAPATEEQLDAEEEEETNSGLRQGHANNSGSAPPEDENRDTPHYRLMTLLEQELPECHRREQIDEIAERFCSTHGSSKNARKRLQKTLFLVPHSRLDLLPYYARMTATVDRIWSDVASSLITDLEQQFHGQAKFKKNQNLDSRMKTARYIGELTKFRVAPPIVALRCLQRCIEDFTACNVDIACCLLESCGRFLYRTRHASSRLATLLDTMLRLSKAKNLDDRLQSLLKAAYYSVKPPPSGPRRKVKEYTPLETYLRHLLLVRLESTDASISLVTKQLIRLPWSDPSQQCGQLVCKLFLKACRKGRYKTIEAIAAVTAKLRSQRVAGEATVRLIDAVIEELRSNLENPNFRDQQRIITYVRLLGELYCSGLVPGQLVMDQLYDFINLGHEIPEALREVSKKFESEKKIADSITDEQAKVYNSAGKITKTIKEDEEHDDAELETKEENDNVKVQAVAVSSYSNYDPRVPAVSDPPNSFYRITLVCSLLEVVVKSLIAKSNLPRIKGFLAAFQRYLFTKDSLPTDVEFALLDTFDILDSQWKKIVKGSTGVVDEQEVGFPRYSNWLDAHNATVANEEADAVLDVQKKLRLESIFDESKPTSEINDALQEHGNPDDDSLLDDDEDDDDVTLSVSAKDSIEGRDDDMAQDIESDIDEDNGQTENDHLVVTDEENADDEIASAGESDEEAIDDEDEFDEEAYLLQMQEEAFERELRRITLEAVEKGKNTSRKQIGESMVSGSQIVKKKEQVKPTEASNLAGLTSGGKIGVSFQVLKKGTKGKVEARELIVPADTNLAMVASKQDDAAARERDEIKQRVLRYEAESAEAEYSGGNVYLEQEKLQIIRNRPLSMEEIDRNFGTTGGNLRASQNETTRVGPRTDGQGRSGRSYPNRGGRGYGGRSNPGGRTLFF